MRSQLLVVQGDVLGNPAPDAGVEVLEESLLEMGGAELWRLVGRAGDPETVDFVVPPAALEEHAPGKQLHGVAHGNVEQREE